MVIKVRGKKERYIGYCPVCKTFFDREWTQKSGRNLEDVFAHQHPLSFIKFSWTNSGHGCVSFEGKIPEEIKETITYLWIGRKMSYYNILDILSDAKKLEETIREVERLEKFTPTPPEAEPNIKLLVKTLKTSLFNVEVKKQQGNGNEWQECRDTKLLGAVIDALNKLPQRFKLPEAYKNCDYGIPRYFVLEISYDGDRAEIINIYNVNRWTLQQGKWNYHNGYWAPSVNYELIESLESYISMLEKGLA